PPLFNPGVGPRCTLAPASGGGGPTAGGAGAGRGADGAGPPAGGAEGTLEIVANGELQAVTGDIMKEDGPYGSFNGFFHPNGIDAVPPTDAGAAAPAPATADQQPTVVA
uniref:hypothetical protein n=1 Tax=Nocardia cyriacigeorgica TaxID=135487 RepID=UPI002453C2F9